MKALAPRSLADHTPPLVLTFVYAVTCLLGALLLLARFGPFVTAFEYFSGTAAPALSRDQTLVALVLLFAPPVLLWLAYVATYRAPLWRRATVPTGPRVLRSQSAIVTSVALTLVALASLLRSGSLANLSSWLSYENWVDARWAAFRSMSFIEFVNIYTFLPLAAAWVVLASQRRFLRWIPTILAIGFALAIYQKKAALIVILLVLSAWALDRARHDPARAGRIVATCLLAAAGLYGAMVLVPTVEPFLVAVATEENGAGLGEQLAAWAEYESSLDRGVTPQIVVSILGRTSGPALTYTIVFPAAHRFYGPDLALDVLCSRRIGCSGRTMPDDNIVVWERMYPNNAGGSVTAPFQFALYSQAGIPWALAGAIALGAILAIWWRAVRARALGAPWSELAGAVGILLAVNLALDSPRNSLLVSYGALWGLAFVLVIAALDRWLAVRSREASARVARMPAAPTTEPRSARSSR
jgi:hypothetical protein